MAWRVTGRWLGMCSCKLVCPCNFGPAEPDEGWCSGSIVLEIERGTSDGVDLGGTKLAWTCEMPKDFFSGNGRGRLYLDADATAEQRRELEAIFKGEKGGPWAAVSAIFREWLPTQTARIEFRWDDKAATVGDIGRVTLDPIKDEAGAQTKLVKAPAMKVFGVESYDLARTDGEEWADPELRRWRAGGNGDIVTRFDWSA